MYIRLGKNRRGRRQKIPKVQESLMPIGSISNPIKRMRYKSFPTMKGKKRGFLDVKALIRSIQRTEGNPDCFGKATDTCDRLDCAWRRYCLEKNKLDEAGEIEREKDRDAD
jgi:hypothetical protein